MINKTVHGNGLPESVDWLKMLEDASPLREMIVRRRSVHGRGGPWFLPEYRAEISSTEFLVPSHLHWRKEVDSMELLQSNTISDKRKKLLRKAIAKSSQLGVEYRLVHPVKPDDFNRFLLYYWGFCSEMDYTPILHESYYSKRSPDALWLIEMWRGEKYLGARLVCRYGKVLSTDYRAIARTREIKEGYDIVCEKLYFELAAKVGLKWLGRGKELNLRGLGDKRIGMLWNKLKYGYRPLVARPTPCFYSDYSFLRQLDFQLVFFVSMENDRLLWETNSDEEPRLQLNFVLGNSPDWAEIRAVIEKSPYRVKIWDIFFNDLTDKTAGAI